MRCQHLFLAVALAAVVACSGVKQDPAPPEGPPPAGWASYETDDGAYQVWMPEGAETHEHQEASIGGSMKLWFLFVNVPGEAMYMLGVATLPPGSIEKGSEDVFFNAFVKSEQRAASRTITQFGKGKAGGKATRWVEYEQEGGVVGQSRALLDSGRSSVYSLTVFWNSSDGKPAHVDDYLRSFQSSE